MRKLIVTAILFAVLLSGCSKTTDESEIVDFALPDLKNNIVRLSDFRGRWVVINFWATWCAPCLQEIPELIRFHKNNPNQDAMVIGVNFEEIDSDLLSEFIQHKEIAYPIVKAGAEPILPFEPLKGLPTTFLVDPDGHLVERHIGPVTKEQLAQMIIDNTKITY